MPLNYPNDGRFDGVLGSMRWVLDLQKRLDASMGPLRAMQKGLDAFQKTQQLTSGLVGSLAWLDQLGATQSASISQQLNVAMQALTLPAFPAPALPDLTGITQLTVLALMLPPAVSGMLADLARVQSSFFQNWSGLAVALEWPAWVQQLEAMQARFDELLADLPTDAKPADLEELVASTALRAEVFALGNDVLMNPAEANPSRFQAVIAAFSNFLAKPVVKDQRDWLAWLFACLMFIGWVREEWQKMQPAEATVGEVAIRQELAQNRTQMALLQLQVARQQGQVRTTPRPVLLYARPAGKAHRVGRLPVDTEVAIISKVRTWVQVIGFDAEGQLLQGWVPEARLQPLTSPATKRAATQAKSGKREEK